MVPRMLLHTYNLPQLSRRLTAWQGSSQAVGRSEPLPRLGQARPEHGSARPAHGLSLSLTHEKVPWATGEVWGPRTLTLPHTGPYTNVLTGEKLPVRRTKLPVAKVLEDFPLALLVRD